MRTTKEVDPSVVEFGRFLRGLRKARGLTLRDVESITGAKISNAYLSQLENGQVKRPSAMVLHTLSAAFGVDYGVLMERAGLQPEPAGPSRVSSVLGELTLAEEAELLRYLAFLRQREA